MSKQASKKQPSRPSRDTDQRQKGKNDALSFEKYFQGQKGLYLFSALAFIIGAVIFWDFLILKNLYLFKDIGSDTVNFSYPQFIHIHNYLRTEGIPKWSFNQGMGQNIFPFLLRDPFNLILYALDKSNLAYGIIYIEFLKILLGGLFFYLYLRTMSFSQYVSIIGGLLFSFSGFMILGSGWYIFTYEALCLALMLYAFERLFLHNKWLLFPIPFFLIGASMPFNLYLYGLFFLIYVVFRFLSQKGWQLKEFLVLTLKIVALSLLGVALSGTFFFSNTLQLMESPRVSGESSFFNTLMATPVLGLANSVNNVTAIFRLFSSDLLGTGLNFRGAYNYLEAPLLYCGLLTLLLVPQVFSSLSKKNKIIYALFLAFWILPVIFPYFRFAFWLFTGDYYRAYSFFVSLSLIMMGVYALQHIDKNFKVNIPVLVITLIALLILLYYPYFPDANANPVEKDLRSVIAFLLFAYALLIFGLKDRGMKFMVQVILLVLLSFELIHLSSITVNKRTVVSSRELNQKVGYNDYTNDALDYLNQTDKGWYRIDKYYSSGPAVHSSINDALIQNFKGTPCYYSFNQKYYIKFLQEVNIVQGTDETQTRWSPGLRGWPLLEAFAGVKYSLSKNGAVDGLYSTYDSIAQFGDVNLFRNKYFMPLGFAYSKYLTASDFKKMTALQKGVSLLRGFVVDDSLTAPYRAFKKIDIKDTISNYTLNDLANDVSTLKQDTLQILSAGQNSLKGKITLKENKLLFLSIPYDQGWSATVDGKKADLALVNVGFMGLTLTPGDHTVELSFEPRYVKSGSILTLASLLIYSGLIFFRMRKSGKQEEQA